MPWSGTDAVSLVEAAQTAGAVSIATSGAEATVIVAEPLLMPAQLAPVTLVIVYVVVLADATVRTAGDVAAVCWNPSDQTSVHGPVPVSETLRFAPWPEQTFCDPLTTA